MVKERYDPSNLFFHNFNIVPAAAVACIAFPPSITAVGAFPVAVQYSAFSEVQTSGKPDRKSRGATSGQVVHEGVACDICMQAPIEGVRYRCGHCADFDLCANCENLGPAHHGHPQTHVFLKLSRAIPAAQRVRLKMPLLPDPFFTVESISRRVETSPGPEASVIPPKRPLIPLVLEQARKQLRHVDISEQRDQSSGVPQLFAPPQHGFVLLSGTTWEQTLENIFQLYAGRPCVGTRLHRPVSNHCLETKLDAALHSARSTSGDSKSVHLNPEFSFLSYAEVFRGAQELGLDLVNAISTHLAPAQLKQPYLVAMLLGNTVAAVVADLACAMQGFSPIFLPQCGPAGTAVLLLELQPCFIIVDSKHWPELKSALELVAQQDQKCLHRCAAVAGTDFQPEIPAEVRTYFYYFHLFPHSFFIWLIAAKFGMHSMVFIGAE
jgi:hypothetical protein